MLTGVRLARAQEAVAAAAESARKRRPPSTGDGEAEELREEFEGVYGTIVQPVSVADGSEAASKEGGATEAATSSREDEDGVLRHD